MTDKTDEDFKKFQEFLKWKENQNKETQSQNNPISENNKLYQETRLKKIKRILLRIIIVIFFLVFILLLAWFIYSFNPDEVEKIFTPQTEQKQVSSTPQKTKKKINYAELGAEAGKTDGTNDGLNKKPSQYRYSPKNNDDYKFFYRNRYDWYYKKAEEFILKRKIEGLPIDKESFNDYTAKELGKLTNGTVAEIEEFPPVPDN